MKGGPAAPRTPSADLLAIDLRSLALLRILLGAVLVADLVYRALDLRAHYTEAGVLPRATHRLAFGEIGGMWSVHLLAGSTESQALLFAVAGAAALALIVGWWTQRAAFVAWLLLVSLQHRQPLVLTGGDSLLAILLFWSLFLPLSARWSIDSRRAPTPTDPSPLVRSAASAALLLQVALVYLFAAGFKLADPAWQRLTALEESFAVEGVATGLARFLLRHPDLLRSATLLTLVLECAVPLLLFLPWKTAQTRTALVGLLWAFHLLGTGLTMELGLIAYVMATASTVLLPGWFWEPALPRTLACLRMPGARAAARHPPRGAPASRAASAWAGRARRLSDLAVALLFAAVAADALASLERPSFRRWIPGGVRSAVRALGLSQNWRLWSTPLRNRYYVFPARLRDGSEIDLHTGQALDWSAPRRRSSNNHWWKYQLHLSRPSGARLREAYADYLMREWNRGRPPERWVAELRLVELRGPWTADPATLARTQLWPTQPRRAKRERRASPATPQRRSRFAAGSGANWSVSVATEPPRSSYPGARSKLRFTRKGATSWIVPTPAGVR